MDSLVNDKQTYEPLKRNPTPEIQRRLNSKLRDLKKTETINIQLYYRLRYRVPQPAKLHVLPKLHNPHIPMRTLVSFCGSPTYQLSKHITSILKPLNWRVPAQITIHSQLNRCHQNYTCTRRPQASILRRQITFHQHTTSTCPWLY